jgi:serine/threonine protein kinase
VDSLSSGDGPIGPPNPHNLVEGFPAKNPSPQQWRQLQQLFERMLDSGQPEAVLRDEPDGAVRDAARRLFRDHLDAAASGFLDEPITLVERLAAPAPPRFAPGQVLAGRFTVECLLGAGGMGEVYLAFCDRLQEKVALKTIRAGLAQDESVRRRFIAEIQNARRVTHANVCRIFDLFEDREIPFFSMQYVPGMRLSEWLALAPAPPAVRRRVALDLCEGLAAAHRNGILHCDFKPANVLMAGNPANPTPVITDFGLARALTGAASPNAHSLEGGTLDYMAPELLHGGHPSLSSDIYALGKVLLQLLPGYRPALSCVAERPEDRPPTLDSLIGRLRSGMPRRLWLLGGLAVGCGGLAGYEMLTRPRLALVSRERLALNWFRPETSDAASLLRNLLITALRQSLLVTIVADDRLRSALGHLNFPARLPAAHADLLAAAEREGIAFVMEGAVTGNGAAARFLLQIFRPAEAYAALAISEPLTANTVLLAEQIARKIRREFGESAAVFQSGYVPLDRLTSASAEAAAFYFRGLALYESAEAEAAIDWFDQAIRIDPRFALAHLSRGIALAARYQWFSAIPSYQRAFDLRTRVSERERLWIEASYYNIVVDFEASLASCRRLAALYPDDAVFQRNTAFAYAASGHPADALPFNRRAIELDPAGVSNASELIVNHAEANQFDEALRLHRQFRQDGVSSTLLDWGAGLAWMGKSLGKSDFEQARQSFASMGSDAKRERWARLLACAPDILQGRFWMAASRLESDLAWDVAMNEQGHQVDRRIWLGHLDRLMDRSDRSRTQAAELSKLGLSPLLLEAYRQSAILALAAHDFDVARAALELLRQAEQRWPSTHSRGVRAHIEALLAADDEKEAMFNQAAGLWPDPPVLLDRARWFLRKGDPASALADCETIDRQPGRILKRYFPGLIALAWMEQARSLAGLSRFAESLRIYERMRKSWFQEAGTFAIIRESADEMTRLAGK